MEVYEIVKSIGGGSFGQVYLARHKREEKQYVIKKIKTRDMTQKERENTENEVKVLRELRHTNIVAYKDSYLDRDQYLNIVMIYCEGGDMYNKIKSAQGKHFSETQVLDWFAQMAMALYYLHEKKILHRDLKTQNIFLKHGRVRLGDFGIAKILDSTRELANTCIGTPYYMSPELFKQKPYSYKSDIWALGCIMYEICNLRHAFDAQSISGLAIKILNGQYTPLSTTYSKTLRELIIKMLSINPKDRPTIWDIINKPIIKKRIVLYMAEIFSGNYPEASMPNDVDDIYVDSLHEQAEKLGILQQIQKQINGEEWNIGDQSGSKSSQQSSQHSQSSSSKKKDSVTGTSSTSGNANTPSTSVIKKTKLELQREIQEKKRVEEELKKLERKKQAAEQIQHRQNSKNQVTETKNDRQSQRKSMPPERKEVQRKDRSVSYEKKEQRLQNLNNQIKNNQFPPTKKSESISVTDSRDDLSGISQQQTSASTRNSHNKLSFKEESSQKNKEIQQQQYQQQIQEANNKKDLILKQKNLKKLEDELKWQQEFKQIQEENARQRQMAQKKKEEMYKPSQALFPYDQNYSSQQSQHQQQGKSLGGNINTNPQESEQDEIQNFDQNLLEQEQIHEEEMIQQSVNQNSVKKGQSHSPQQQVQKKSKHQVHIQEEYDMDDEEKYLQQNEEDENDKIILEEDEEEESENEKDQNDPGVIEQKLKKLKTILIQKTLKINELQETLNKSKIGLNTNQNIKSQIVNDNKIVEGSLDDNIQEEEDEEQVEDEGNDDDDLEDYDENEGEIPPEGKRQYNPQYYKLADRIKLLKHRCEAGLGANILEQAYEYLKDANQQSLKQEELRKQMIEILGEDQIGFWHLLDQILQLEELLQQIPQLIKQ